MRLRGGKSEFFSLGKFAIVLGRRYAGMGTKEGQKEGGLILVVQWFCFAEAGLGRKLSGQESRFFVGEILQNHCPFQGRRVLERWGLVLKNRKFNYLSHDEKFVVLIG